MAKAHNIQSWLNGDRLRSKGFRQLYPLIGLIACLIFLYILAGYQAVRQQHRLTDAKKEMLDAKFRYMTIHKRLTETTLQSHIKKMLNDSNQKSTLIENTKPAIKIVKRHDE